MSIASHYLQVKRLEISDYEKVMEFTDESSGLHCLIAIHNTRLGPALGGTRVYPYATVDEALTDLLRLAKGMTYKAAIARTGTGGGKSVIIGDSKTVKSRALLLAFAEAVNFLGGSYICAEDAGITAEDLKVMREGTQYIVGIPHLQSSGDPCRYTAAGVIKGLQALSQKRWETTSLKGKKVAIQGLGAVGQLIADRLYWDGADLIVADVDLQKCTLASQLFGAKIVDSKEIHKVQCDIFCPCAMGAILNAATIPELQCELIGGSANNQLLSVSDADLLLKRNILYAPDFVINAGGLINVSFEIGSEDYDPKKARQAIDCIYIELLEIFERSERQKRSTSEIALEIAEEKLDKGIGRREKPPVFHH